MILKNALLLTELLWNCLPNEIVCCKTVNYLKSILCTHDLSIFLKGQNYYALV